MKEVLPPISVWAKVSHGPFNIIPTQLVTTWSLKQYEEKQWRKSISIWIGFEKLRLTAYSRRLLIPVRGRDGILLTCSQVKLGSSQNSSFFTLTLDKIPGTGGGGGVYSKILLERSQISLIIEGSLRIGLLREGPKMLSMSSKTLKKTLNVRVSKVEKWQSSRLDSKSIFFANFARLDLLR